MRASDMLSYDREASFLRNLHAQLTFLGRNPPMSIVESQKRGTVECSIVNFTVPER